MKRLLLVTATAMFATQALAQGAFPSRTVALVVGFAPGGGTDTVARIMARDLVGRLGQQVIVENRDGAGGNIATDMVAKSAPDGHTVLLGNVGSLTVAPHLLSKLPYKPLQDLAPVTMAVIFPNAIVVPMALPAKTLGEFIKMAKDKPGAISYGSSGIGGAGHLAGELLKMQAGIDLLHVPYKGGGPAMVALLAGEINTYFATPVSVRPHLISGKVRVLATTGPQRDPTLPEIPTVAESGYPNYQATNWYAYVVAGKTPGPVIARLNQALTQSLRDPGVLEALKKQGLSASPGTPEQLRTFMQSEYDTWGKVVKQAKMQIE
jgi:tripartite-type tricarboxylate transporter receptor subunit TctC